MQISDRGEGFERSEMELEKIDTLMSQHMNLIPRLGKIGINIP